MKIIKRLVILVLLLLTFITVSSQSIISKRFSGYYINVKNSNVNFTMWLYKDTCGILFNDPALQKKKTDDYHRDAVMIEVDFQGGVKVMSDIIFISSKGEKVLELKILDSLSLLVKSSLLNSSKNDTLFRVKAFDDSSNQRNVYWIYSFYYKIGEKYIFYSDIEDKLSFPVNPMWTLFDRNYRIIKQFQDTNYIHPLSRRFRNEIKF